MRLRTEQAAIRYRANCHFLVRESEAVLQGAVQAIGPGGHAQKYRQLRRIEEYEKFLTNCNIVKEKVEAEMERREREKVKRRNTVMEGMTTEPEYSLLIRSKSLTYLDVILNQGEMVKKQPQPSPKTAERFSMPPLVDYNSILDLQDKILLWQSCAGPWQGNSWERERTSSLREVKIYIQNISKLISLKG